MGGCHSKKSVQKNIKRTEKFNETVIVKTKKVLVTTSAIPRSLAAQSEPIPTDVNDIFVMFLNLDKRLQASRDYEINPDDSQLFTSVNEAVLKRPLFLALQAAQKIYHSERGHEIVYNTEDKKIQWTLIDLVLNDKVMQFCLAALRQNGYFIGDIDEFRQKLYELWFHLWGNSQDTCAFEHVFVGERAVHNGVGIVVGFHNWVQYYRQQQRGGITNYVPLALPQNNQIAQKDALIVKMSFDWLGQHKEVDSMFIGTTPAFEMAIYTYLFFSVDEDKSSTPIQLGGHDFEIHMIKDGNRIITTYPEVID